MKNQMKALKIALTEYGVTEKKGTFHNPTILRYFKYVGHSWVKDDETAWCSAFASYCAKKAGLLYSKKLSARSWMNVGSPTETPKLGDIVVFWREKPSSWKGHVGFYISQDKEYIYTLGGNQSNMVCIKAYPKNRLLGYRKISI